MFVAMLGGLQAFGAVGIIIGPVLFATASEILNLLRDAQPSVGDRSVRRIESSDTSEAVRG